MRQIFFTLLFALLAIACVLGGVVNHEKNSLRADADLSKMRYLLWTRSNSGNNAYYELELGNSANMASSPFDASLPTYILHPGWGASGTTSWITDGKTSLLSLVDSNIISCDWGDVIDHANYDADVERMYQVAVRNAEVIDWIVAETGISTSTIEMTGHSLGAHCIGMTALSMTSGTVARMTGLDPAGPEFYNKNSTMRLDKSQATFVDIIHTNGCPATDICYGIGQSLGHVDFFPGGGEHQNGCVFNPDGTPVLDSTGCSHGRACSYWVESLDATITPTNDQFNSWPCTSWTDYQDSTCTACGQGCLNMGHNVDRSLEGSYFLSTNARSPFAMGDVQQ